MFVYVMEYLSNEHFTHLNTADDISGWSTADIKVLTPLNPYVYTTHQLFAQLHLPSNPISRHLSIFFWTRVGFIHLW